MFSQLERQQVWNCTHQEKPASEQPEKAVVDFADRLRQKLPPEARLLDAGCGRGRNALFLAQMNFTVYGCDLSPVAIEIARTRAYQARVPIDFQVADLRHLPFPERQFGVIVCVHVLPYNFKAEIAQSIRELWRVLQPSGWLYFDLLDCEDAEYGCGPKLEEHTFFDPDGAPIHFSSRQEVHDLLYGFEIEHLEQLRLGSLPKVRVAWSVWAKKKQ